MTGILGWILIILGIISIVIGLVQGAKDVFAKTNQGAAQASLPTEFLKVLEKLLDAGPAKFFMGTGLLLVVIGLVLNGVSVFAS